MPMRMCPARVSSVSPSMSSLTFFISGKFSASVLTIEYIVRSSPVEPP